MSKLRPFAMPKWGIEMTEGRIAEWRVAEGADFAKGDILALIETDKITNEVEAEQAGRMARIVAAAGETRPVGALLAVFAETGQAAAPAELETLLRDFGAGNSNAAPAIPASLAVSPAARARAEQDRIDVSQIAGSGRNGRITLQDVDQASLPAAPLPDAVKVSVAPATAHLEGYFATPLAKRIAVNHGIPLDQVVGSGARGRIRKADVLACVAAPEPAPAPVPAPQPAPPQSGTRILPMSPMRKAIARQLTLSKSTIPHFYLRNSARIDALNNLRRQAKEATGMAPSINDYLVRACALALHEFPEVNIQVHGDDIHSFAHADIAVAVATDKGLLTPIVRHAETKPVMRLSMEIKDLAERARAGRLQTSEFQGGSFTISNLGMFGIDQFDAIINPPQGAILAVGAARESVEPLDHALAFATRIALSLSCDHRAIDGAVGARFLAEVTRLIETPTELTS